MPTLKFNAPRSHSIAYRMFDAENAPSEWLIIMPGVNVEVPDAVWNKVKNHPDIKMFLDQKLLEILNKSPDIDETKDLGGVKAITKGDGEPIPVSQPKITKPA